ncbi:MAG: ABC transporter ATP-binding protein [Aquabacterium sp.]
MSAPPVLHLQHLHFAWRRGQADLLDVPDFQVARGESVLLLGHSGCGKSTLLSLMAGVLTATSGRIALLGQDWSALRASRRDALRADHVGYIFQQFNLLPYLSALDNVMLPCRFSRLRRERAGRDPRASAMDLLRQVGLPEAVWRQPASQLSVGQQQRVAAARALIGHPELLIADEPTSALDEDLRDSFMRMLRDSQARQHSALVFVSHDTRLGPHFDRVVRLPELNRAAHAQPVQPEAAA